MNLNSNAQATTGKLVEFAVFKLQRVSRRQTLSNFSTGIRIKKHLQPVSRADPHMMITFGTNKQIPFDLCPLQLRTTLFVFPAVTLRLL